MSAMLEFLERCKSQIELGGWEPDLYTRVFAFSGRSFIHSHQQRVPAVQSNRELNWGPTTATAWHQLDYWTQLLPMLCSLPVWVLCYESQRPRFNYQALLCLAQLAHSTLCWVLCVKDLPEKAKTLVMSHQAPNLPIQFVTCIFPKIPTQQTFFLTLCLFRQHGAQRLQPGPEEGPGGRMDQQDAAAVQPQVWLRGQDLPRGGVHLQPVSHQWNHWWGQGGCHHQCRHRGPHKSEASVLGQGKCWTDG